jgi:hypothetical protein
VYTAHLVGGCTVHMQMEGLPADHFWIGEGGRERAKCTKSLWAGACDGAKGGLHETARHLIGNNDLDRVAVKFDQAGSRQPTA